MRVLISAHLIAASSSSSFHAWLEKEDLDRGEMGRGGLGSHIGEGLGLADHREGGAAFAPRLTHREGLG